MPKRLRVFDFGCATWRHVAQDNYVRHTRGTLCHELIPRAENSQGNLGLAKDRALIRERLCRGEQEMMGYQ